MTKKIRTNPPQPDDICICTDEYKRTRRFLFCDPGFDQDGFGARKYAVFMEQFNTWMVAGNEVSMETSILQVYYE